VQHVARCALWLVGILLIQTQLELRFISSIDAHYISIATEFVITAVEIRIVQEIRRTKEFKCTKNRCLPGAVLAH